MRIDMKSRSYLPTGMNWKRISRFIPFLISLFIPLVLSVNMLTVERGGVNGTSGAPANQLVLHSLSTPTNLLPVALRNPIPEPIELGSITVNAVDFLRLPQTEDPIGTFNANRAFARIQYMKAAPDESGRLFVNDTRGVLYVTDTEELEATVYLDLRDEDVGFYPNAFPNEAGFQGFAFHPDFGNEEAAGYGKLYTAFSADPTSGTADWVEDPGSVQESVLMEWTAADPSTNVFKGSKRELLRVGQFAANHNIGDVAFNPSAEPESEDEESGDDSLIDPNDPSDTDDSVEDELDKSADYGNLYVTIGDGGNAHDPRNNGQNDKNPLGAVLRINPLETEDGAKYGIPEDNPFVEGEMGFPELWAYGLRHPQHFSWDAEGRMFLIDIGQDQIEEVNIGVAGANYGWRLREGTFATAMSIASAYRNGPVYNRPDEDEIELVYPIAQYDHDEGYALGSGFVYQGEAIEELQNKYVFADLVRGRVFYIETEELTPDEPAKISELNILFNSENASITDIAGMRNPYKPGEQRVDLRLSVDAENELYLLTKADGWIRKLEPVN